MVKFIKFVFNSLLTETPGVLGWACLALIIFCAFSIAALIFILATEFPLVVIPAIPIGLIAYIYREYRKRNGKI